MGCKIWGWGCPVSGGVVVGTRRDVDDDTFLVGGVTRRGVRARVCIRILSLRARVYRGCARCGAMMMMMMYVTDARLRRFLS